MLLYCYVTILIWHNINGQIVLSYNINMYIDIYTCQYTCLNIIILQYSNVTILLCDNIEQQQPSETSFL